MLQYTEVLSDEPGVASMMLNANPYVTEVPLQLLVKGALINGDLCVPRSAKEIVVLATGSRGSRRSSSLRFIASTLQKAEIGTLTIDLLTEEENTDNLFPVDQLTDRLLSVIHWVWGNDQTAGLPIGLFGEDMGATVALKAAGQLGEEISAVVAFGGDYDLDYRELYMVKAPTLLIVPNSDGGRESVEHVLRELCCVKKLEIIPETSFLYDHERASEIIAPLSTCWFRAHLSPVVEAAGV